MSSPMIVRFDQRVVMVHDFMEIIITDKNLR